MSDRSNIETFITEVETRLAKYKKDYKSLSWREKVLLVVKIGGSLKKLGKYTNPALANESARERIRQYLLENVGVIVTTAELEVVSGIRQYARRIRELRKVDGYKILTMNSRDPEMGIELGRDDYLLLSREPDYTAARRWEIANRIRKEPGGAREKLLRYFIENVRQVLTTEELAYVAKIKQYARRVRELRTEDGYAIATIFTGRPDLKPGEYVLQSETRRAEPHTRNIQLDIQKVVYERAGHKCQVCQWDPTQGGPRILELHHLEKHEHRGANVADNLRVLCNKCHDEVHAGRLRLLPDF